MKSIVFCVIALLGALVSSRCSAQPGFQGELQRLNNAASYHWQEEQYSLVKADLRAAIRLDPSDPQAQYALGKFLLSRGDIAAADAHFISAGKSPSGYAFGGLGSCMQRRSAEPVRATRPMRFIASTRVNGASLPFKVPSQVPTLCVWVPIL